MAKTQRNKVGVTIQFPEDIHREMKVAAQLEHGSMASFIIRAVEGRTADVKEQNREKFAAEHTQLTSE
jgi:uncharacterized protein (DUF1778 family)